MAETIEYNGLEILKEQPTEAHPFNVTDYPYGFNRRTQMRCYIETTKRGQRFVSQTLNPKSGNWNKPKKSTYSRMLFIGLEPETGHVKQLAIDAYSQEGDTKAIAALSSIFSKFQQSQATAITAIHKVMDKVEFKIRTQQFRHKVTGEIVEQVPLMQLNEYEEVTDEEQDKTQDKIQNAICHTMVSEMEQNGLNHDCAVERLKR